MSLRNVFIVGAKRTPFGSFGGQLKGMTGVQLGVVATQAALQDSMVDPSIVDSIYFGNVIPAGNDAAYTSRHIGLHCGLSTTSTALTVNRLCGSGFETLLQACNSIQLSQAEICVSGGTESMSQAPLAVRGDRARWGTPLGQGLQLEDTLWSGLTDAYAQLPMGKTAENLAVQYNISRQDCDQYAIQSQQRFEDARQNGRLEAELAPITVKNKRKGDTVMTLDEHARPNSTLEKISTLPPVFGGVVTAANASGICDGAGSLVVASQDAVGQHNLTPLARVVAMSVTGCDPTIMGIGPVQAIRNVLTKANLTMNDIDRVEINEAFAAQVLACQKELELDDMNVDGGAIAVGHPLAASGSRITAHLCHQPGKYHIGAACIGGGQGMAVLLEKC